MSTPDAGHGHGHQSDQFMPEAHFAVQAQQEEIDQLRADLKNTRDRLIYMRATLLQMQAEAQHQLALKAGENEQLRAELEDLRKRITPTQQGAEGMPTDPDDIGLDGDNVVPHNNGQVVGEFDGPNLAHTDEQDELREA